MKRVSLLLCWLFLTSSTIADEQPETVVDLRVMSFNIEWGGTHVSFENVVEAIRLSGAEIVGIQEAEGNLERLANELDWYFDERNYVISKYPLHESPASQGKYVLVEVLPERVVAISNIHLPSDPYGVDLIRDGATIAAVLANEHAVRMPMLTDYLAVLPQLLDASIPVVITGDFNTPTHTDWTDASVGQRKFMKYAVAWPVSIAMQEAGFTDVWRHLFPDPKKNPGLTWWAGRPPLKEYAPGDNDAQDRIDLMWVGGSIKPNEIRIVGEEDGPEVSISVDPWPSDHRALVANLSVALAPMPKMVTTGKRVYRTGEQLEISYWLGKSGGNLVLANMETGQALDIVTGANGAGQIMLPLSRSGYFRVGMDNVPVDEWREYWVLARYASPVIEVSHSTADTGANITVTWRDGPGFRNDYVAIYSADDDVIADNFVCWAYTDARPSGEATIGAETPGCEWPLAPGNYVARLMKDDGYEVLASSIVFEVP